MITCLTGTLEKLKPQEVCVHVGGVGYLVMVPLAVYERLEDGANAKLLIESYIREDRFDLFGFLESHDRMLFKKLTAISGIGPKMSLEICSLPRSELHRAATLSDARVLAAVKGIGAKRAEKILPDIKAICEDYPEILHDSASQLSGAATDDEDVLIAVTALGYERMTVLKVLRALPGTITRTEDRVAAVLRSM